MIKNGAKVCLIGAQIDDELGIQTQETTLKNVLVNYPLFRLSYSYYIFFHFQPYPHIFTTIKMAEYETIKTSIITRNLHLAASWC